jgi:hypothetical protein
VIEPVNLLYHKFLVAMLKISGKVVYLLLRNRIDPQPESHEL